MTTTLPNEILERITYFAGSRVALAIGLELDREILFLDKGISYILEDVLSKGADIRSLLQAKNYITSNVAIYKAVLTKNITIIRRVCTIWNSLDSELGYAKSYELGFTWGIENLKETRPYNTVMLNFFYVRTKEYDKLDLSIDKPFGDLSWTYMTRTFIPENLRQPATLLPILDRLNIFYKDRNMGEIHKILDNLLESNPPIDRYLEELKSSDCTVLEEMLVDVMDGKLDPENSMSIFKRCVDSGHITHDNLVTWAMEECNVGLLELLDFEHKKLYFMLINYESTEESCSMYKDYIQRDKDTLLQMLINAHYMYDDDPVRLEDDINWEEFIDLEVVTPEEEKRRMERRKITEIGNKNYTLSQIEEMMNNKGVSIERLIVLLKTYEKAHVLRVLIESYGLDMLDRVDARVYLESGDLDSAWLINLCLNSGRKLSNYRKEAIIPYIQKGKLQVADPYFNNVPETPTPNYKSSKEKNIYTVYEYFGRIDETIAVYMYANGLYSIIDSSLI